MIMSETLIDYLMNIEKLGIQGNYQEVFYWIIKATKS